MSMQTTETMPMLLTTKEVASLLRMSESSVRTHPELQAMRIDISQRAVRWRRSDIEDFLAKPRKKSNKQ